jgi:hypothetical protein
VVGDEDVSASSPLAYQSRAVHGRDAIDAIYRTSTTSRPTVRSPGGARHPREGMKGRQDRQGHLYGREYLVKVEPRERG